MITLLPLAPKLQPARDPKEALELCFVESSVTDRDFTFVKVLGLESILDYFLDLIVDNQL